MPKGLNEYPAPMKKKEIEDYIMVTEHNHKDMIKPGRIYYVIEANLQTPMMYGKYCIYPCLRPNAKLEIRGDMSMPIHDYVIHCEDGQSYEDWKSSYASIINKAEREKKLFVNKKEKLATFTWK